MVASLFTFLLLGYPVAFTLGGIALFFGLYGLGLDFMNLLPHRIWGIMTNFTLLAVPLFIFMGVMLERSGLAENLLNAMALLLRRLKGGMAIAVIIAGALLAASTGIVGASVVTMGLISLPVMLKRGYQPEFSCGVICAAGTLGQIIPPSIVLVLLGDIMGVSVGELFIAAVVPGLMLVTSYLVLSVVLCRFGKGLSASNEMEEQAGDQEVSRLEIILELSKALLPPGLLIVAVLGSIFFGIASPTEAAAVGGFGALLLALASKKLTLSVLKDVNQTTTQLTSMVFLILIGATAFGLVFRGLGGDEVITNFVVSLPYGTAFFIFLVMLLLFVLGCFLDFIEIVFIVVPILIPIIQELGLDPLWFAILIAMNLQTSFLTPPLGFALFFLKGVAPEEISSTQIYRGVVPFVIVQSLVLALIIIFPALVTWLPQVFNEFLF